MATRTETRLASPLLAPAGARRNTSRRFSRIRTRGSPGSAAAIWSGRGLPRRRPASRPASVRITTNYDEVLAARNVDIVSITTPNHLHADQAVAAAQRRQALRSRKADRPRRGGARPHSRRRANRWRANDRVVRAPLQPVSEVRALAARRRLARRDPLRAHAVSVPRHRLGTAGWDWVRTRESGRSHLLAAGCHAVDALRFCTGLEPIAVSALPHAVHRRATSGRRRSSRT